MRDLYVNSLLSDWSLNGDYALKLTADLTAEQMVHQPAAGMNHPAWVLSHLHAYHPVMIDLLTGKTPTDPLNHEYGMKSSPVADASAYLPKDELRDAFAQGHADVASALEATTAELLGSSMPLDRWTQRFPQVGSILPYLMSRHEALHLGQISAWRRVQGLPSV